MIEMDKSKDVRPRASRFSKQQVKQSGHKLLSGLNGDGFVPSLGKSKRIKRLSSVNNSNNKGSCNYEVEEENKCEMGGGGCDVSDKEEIQAPSSNISSSSSKRFKLPRKFFDDCNGVDHASVPRKLRSAMKKRNHESISPPFPDSKKSDHTNSGIESPKRHGAKTSKMNVNQAGEQSDGGSITKDEEEVAETLFALAKMFPDHVEPESECKLDNSSDASPMNLPESSERPPDFEAVKEDLNSICLSKMDEHGEERLHEETAKDDCLNQPSIQELPNLPSNKTHSDLSCSAELNFPTMLAKQEETKPLCNSVNPYIALEESQDAINSKHTAQLEMSLHRKPVIALGLTATGSKIDQQNATSESKNNGQAMWRGLPSSLSSGACAYPSLSQSSQTSPVKFPSWMDITLHAARPCSFHNCSSIGKVSEVNNDRRSWKRSTTHVYISRLIKNLQMPQSEDNLPAHSNQIQPQDILRQGAVVTVKDFNGTGNSLNGVALSNAIVKTTDKLSNQVGSGIVQHQRLHQDLSQTSSVGGVCNFQKQTFNFLSLSTGERSLEGHTTFSGVGNQTEQSAQLQFAYLNSRLPHSAPVPFSLSQTRYTSSSYTDQPAAAGAQQAHLQLPPYFGNLCFGAHTSPSGFTKQQEKQHLHLHQHHLQLQLQSQQQQQHHHHQLWAAQLAAIHCRSAGNSTTMTQIPTLQNRRRSALTQIPSAQTIIPSSSSSSSSQDALGLKYPQISQQQLMTVAALPHARLRRQDDHISSVYEDTGGGFRTGGALPLQLLCNEGL